MNTLGNCVDLYLGKAAPFLSDCQSQQIFGMIFFIYKHNILFFILFFSRVQGYFGGQDAGLQVFELAIGLLYLSIDS